MGCSGGLKLATCPAKLKTFGGIRRKTMPDSRGLSLDQPPGALRNDPCEGQGRQHQPPGCRAKSNKTSNGPVIAVAPLIPSPEEIDAALESQRRLDSHCCRSSHHPYSPAGLNTSRSSAG